MASPPLVWTEPFRIRATEVGPDERATVLALADLLQEAAGEHARASGREHFDLEAGRGTWVLARMRLAVARRPALREAVTVETWPSAYEGVRVHRDFLLRGEGGAVDVRATSVWFVIDVARRRPVRLPPSMHTFGPPADHERALDVGDPPEAPASVEAEQAFAVRHADLDRVGHANNVRFLEWALEAAGGADGLREIDVAYRAEAVLGDRVVSLVGPRVDGVRAHEIVREADGRTLARARTLWT